MTPSRFAFTLFFVVAATGCHRQPAYYIQRGNKFFQDVKYADAIIQYRKAIQIDSRFGEAYYRLGRAQLADGNPSEAYRALNQAKLLMPANPEVTASLADLNLFIYLKDRRRPPSAYEQVDKLSGELLKKNPNSVAGLRLKGALALVDRKPKEAIEFYRKANQIQPSDRGVVEGLTQALFLDNQSTEGERLALDFLQKDKKAVAVYDILYAHYMIANRLAEAENLLKSKVDNNPEKSNYRLQLAGHFARVRKPAEMDATLKGVLDHPKEFPNGRLEVGDFYIRLGSRDRALREFEEGARANPKGKVIYQKRIAEVLGAQGKREEARSLLEQMLKDNPKDSEIRAARATVMMQSGKPEDVEAATAAFQSLVKENPNDADTRFKLAQAYIRSGKLEAAQGELTELVKQRPQLLPARLAMAELAIRRQKPEQALEATQEILSMDPNQAQAKLLHAIALTNLSLYPRARAELEEFLKLFPGSTDAKVQLGAVAIGQKQYREAQSIFQKMDETVSGDPRGVIGLTATFAAQNQLDKALQLLQAEKKRSPQSSVIANLLARTAMQAGNFDLAIETYRELLESNQRSADLNLSLGRALMAKRDFANAIPALERAQALAPKDSRADLLLVSALKQSGRTGEVKAHLQRALSADPNNPIVLNSMAFYLADAGGDLDEALQLSQRVVTKYKDQPNFADTLGWIYLKKDLRDPALKIFSNLVKKQPDNPTFHYHLGAALAANGEKQKAREELEAALRSSPPKDQEQKIREILAKLG